MKVFKVKEERQGIWLMGTTFSNVGFMGFPVIHAMYGENGLFLTSFVNIAFNISFYSIGVFILTMGQEQKSIDWKDMFVNNIMFASSPLGFSYILRKFQFLILPGDWLQWLGI